MPDNSWITATHCATKCMKPFKTELESFDSCYIKYSLLEPFYEQAIEDSLHLGIRKDYYSDDIYRYTGLFFFESDFSIMIKNAEEIEVTFDLEYDANYNYYIDEQVIAERVFRNSVILKGHSFRNVYDLRTHWDNVGYIEFKSNYYCPYVCTEYEKLQQALKNKEPNFTITLNSILLREFEKCGVKGLHLFCHNEMKGHWRVKDSCKIKITKHKVDYNNVIYSTSYATYKNTRELKSAKIKRTKRIIENDLLCGHDRQHIFYFFDDDFHKMILKAKEMDITFNVTWFNSSDQSDLNDISINKNFTKSPVLLTGHRFRNIEELEAVGNDKYAVFGLDHKGHPLDGCVYASENFSSALEAGETKYTLHLTESDVDNFCYSYGFRIGKQDDTKAGQWFMSDSCEVRITKFKDELEDLNAFLDDSLDWVFKDKITVIGRNKKISSMEHAAYYFFDNYNEALNADKLKSLRIRLNHVSDLVDNMDSPYKRHFYICGHNYDKLEDVEDNYNYKDNTIGILKVLEKDALYSDLYITDKATLDLAKQYKGICIYSMRNSSITTHGALLSIYVNYEQGIIETKDRVFTYHLNSNTDDVANTYLNGSYEVDERFLCGNIKGDQLKPFVFFKSDLHDFLNSNINIHSIAIRIIAGDPVDKNVNKKTYTSQTLLENVDIYTHDVMYDGIYCYSYQYKNKLCTVNLMSGQYTNIDQNTNIILDKTHLVYALKNSYGIGAYAPKAKNSDFIYVKEFQIIVTYTE